MRNLIIGFSLGLMIASVSAQQSPWTWPDTFSGIRTIRTVTTPSFDCEMAHRVARDALAAIARNACPINAGGAR